MTESEVTEKFRSNARQAISEQHADAVIAAVNRLESADNAKTIVELLKP